MNKKHWQCRRKFYTVLRAYQHENAASTTDWLLSFGRIAARYTRCTQWEQKKVSLVVTWLQALETEAARMDATPIIAGDLNVRQSSWGGIKGILGELAQRGVPGQGFKTYKISV